MCSAKLSYLFICLVILFLMVVNILKLYSRIMHVVNLEVSTIIRISCFCLFWVGDKGSLGWHFLLKHEHITIMYVFVRDSWHFYSQLWFTRLPPVLTFELSRFQFNQQLGRPEKIHNKIEFPRVIYVDRWEAFIFVCFKYSQNKNKNKHLQWMK